jgi:hypothetical protein
MLRTIAIAAAVFSLALAGAADAKSCRDAKGKFVKCEAAAAAPAATTSATTATSTKTSTTGGHPVCKKGKPCGNSCIAVNKVCHK